jgi:hypothetical protein
MQRDQRRDREAAIAGDRAAQMSSPEVVAARRDRRG